MALLALLLMASLQAAPATAAVATKPPTWLAGAWISDEGGRWTEEYWTSWRGGMMLGAGRNGKGDRQLSFEQMRIVAEDGGLALYASPGGRTAVRFPAISASADSIIFENLAHDYPTRIQYRRDGDTLSATTTGPEGSQPESWRYRKLGN